MKGWCVIAQPVRVRSCCLARIVTSRWELGLLEFTSPPATACGLLVNNQERSAAIWMARLMNCKFSIRISMYGLQ